MAQKVTLGGDRLGSGNKNKIALKNYERSTHNLSQNWCSSMGAGILYPFLCIPAMRGDAFEIDLEAAARTIPTKGPLFGSFKMQLDVFQCPARLYQAILHNNPTAIGLKMAQVKFPMLEVFTKTKQGGTEQDGKFSNSCLLKYLGMSGLGRNAMIQSNSTIGRKILAIPALAYYDIFKNYYSNKQEQNAYVIDVKDAEEDEISVGDYYWGGKRSQTPNDNINIPTIPDLLYIKCSDPEKIVKNNLAYDFSIKVMDNDDDYSEDTLGGFNDSAITEGLPKIFNYINYTNEGITFSVNWDVWKEYLKKALDFEMTPITWSKISEEITITEAPETLQLKPFDLKNIDDMRMKILSHNNLGTAFTLKNAADDDGVWGYDSGTDASGLPYSTLFKTLESNGKTQNAYALNGLLVKTYQSDLFNNWVNTEWIDGENGIAEITKISTADGSFKIDALNLAEKLYNMLNRVAVSGGTYEDWQDAVYTQSPRRHIESPIYLGGMSNEVVFEEIVQTAPAETTSGASQLGSLGGRGTLVKRKGGNVDVKVDEASFIIGIVSLTPRTYQTQGNEWYLTDLETMDDLHKPALDGIGFQNLIGEQMAWFDSVITPNSTSVLYRSVIGKVPAWINYMTALDKAYGDFAEENGNGFMVLGRHYDQVNNNGELKGIQDATTYIDPTKYNYAFAYTELDAQNFWVQIKSNIRARRLMSAKQIPNI